MNKEDLRIVFMGTPDFAVETLRVLVENDYNIVGVITMPDKPSGRGHKLQHSAVKRYALEKGLTLLQPEKLKEETFINDLRDLKADLQIVVAFRMLPEIVWDMPKMGTFNLHASLLPQYRGAAPINWAIINGEKETGATTFFLTHEIDTGKIILQDRIPISKEDNVGKVHDELMVMGAQLVKKTVDLILTDNINAEAQEQFYKEGEELKSAPKIFKETCCIDWNKDVNQIYNHIRGLSPHPAAWSLLHNSDNEEPITVKIYAAHVIVDEPQGSIGSISTDNKKVFSVACNGGTLVIDEMQLSGKKVMKTEDLLRGYKFKEGNYFK